MSAPAVEGTAVSSQPVVEKPGPGAKRPRWRRLVIGLVILSALIAGLGWLGHRFYRWSLEPPTRGTVPLALVRKGDVTLTVRAKGQLEGGKPEVISAPMTGMGEMRIKLLRTPGELVNEGDVVVAFDTTDQDYKLKEAEADLAEAEQQVIKAKAESEAQREDNAYSLLKARADVRQAELEIRKNRLLPAINARQNELALDAARDRLAQIEHDLSNRAASSEAAIAIQEAAHKKAQTQAETARRNIEMMTVRARRAGYVSVKQNTNTNFYMTGMTFPLFRVGDRAYPGMAIAEIPDLKQWELAASISELDRGHLAQGQAVEIHVVAVPYRAYKGRIKDLGGTTGPSWNRRFECRMTLDDPTPDLRPGMNAELTVTTEVMRGVLWVPAQAVFESDGRTFVYTPAGSGFGQRDVKIVRKSESKVVISGLSEGQPVTLASPDQQVKKGKSTGGAMQALPK